MADKPPGEVGPGSTEILLYRVSRNEASSTIECYLGDSICCDSEGTLSYALFYKQFGSPSFTQILSYQGGVGGGGETNSFLKNKAWTYTHLHGSSESGQYYVVVTNTVEIGEIYMSSTISFPKFSGYGKKQTRYSGNSSLKSQRKTRKQIPGF